MNDQAIFACKDVPYYEADITSSRHVDEAERLCRLNQQYPLTARDIERTLGALTYEARGFLLYTHEPVVRYKQKKLWYPNSASPIWTPDSPSLPFSPQRCLQHWQTMVLEGFLMLVVHKSAGDRGGPLLYVDALCRDPWASVSAIAFWAAGRAQGLAERAGCREIRLEVSETDVPLQQEMLALGYMVYDYTPEHLLEEEDRPWNKRIGKVMFSEILRPRRRFEMGDSFVTEKYLG